MSRYKVIIERRPQKALGKLPNQIQRRIRKALFALAEEPRPRGARQLKGDEDAYRIRVGDYRVIYEIRDKVLVVLVIRIAHRSKAYKK